MVSCSGNDLLFRWVFPVMCTPESTNHVWGMILVVLVYGDRFLCEMNIMRSLKWVEV